MSRTIVSGCTVLMLVIAIIVGCESTPYQSLNPNRSQLDPNQINAPSAMPLALAPRQESELLIVEKSSATRARPQMERVPDQSPEPQVGGGALIAKLADQKQIPIPLKHTDVRAGILGYISTVDVTQQYTNPYNEKIEAVYVFPLPQDAAVSDFVMTIGDRKIRGIIREKEEAQRIYQQARAQGYVASLLTQDRPNIFTQSIANIEPGKQIDVNIRYFNTLQYVDGWYEFTFPMVVGPRFNPPGSTGGIGAKAHGSVVEKGTVGPSGQKKEIAYLKPSERTGHDIALTVNVNTGVSIEKIESVNHRITSKTNPTGAQITLNSDDAIPNKDFVLRYKIAGDKLKSALITQRDDRGDQNGGFFTLMLFPPESLKDLPRTPLEMVFTLDVSGSMSGAPIEQSRAAIKYALTHMRPDDTFQIIRFAGSTEAMSPEPLPATPQNVQRALQSIQTMSAGGVTMMLEGIKQSLNDRRDESRLRYITFLTDGYIGNETQILSAIRKSRGDSRLFSFGVGSSPNRYLLDGMARIGAGTAAYLSLNDDANKVMADYFERIAHPAMSDIAVDFGAMSASDVFPQKIPDLFVARPVMITGRFKGEAPDSIRVRGKVGGVPQEMIVKTNPGDNQASVATRAKGVIDNTFNNTFDAGANSAAATGIVARSATQSALPAVWARSKIADLSDAALDDTQPAIAVELPNQIKTVALEYGLVSAYTSFVAVDSATVTAGTHGTTVNVPVPVPAGVRYETTVTEGSTEIQHAD